ncbi:MAG: ABC transporter ATP-binding protein [Desulfatiglans sp.]|jgi:cobalt/nickel transport system ATP-binding protein|nr:ABC transporter ATP-binding protein [Thermodesulfobacteriota bacterium]MEE4351310.1 ABC transporter ATP-binding protein [Desulfatiglans sp.]
MDTKELIIDLEEVSFRYDGSRQALDGLNLSLCKGEHMGVMGANGSGKTTMFHVIMGLLSPDSGRIELFGRNIKEEKDYRDVRQRIGLLFQDADDQLFSPTVFEDVAFGPLNLGKSKSEARAIAEKTLDQLGLSGFGDRITYKLSGGEKRLVSLATVLAMEPEVLLLDEPTAGLDDATKVKLIEILPSLDLSYILISHELEFLAQTTTFVKVMEKGRIAGESYIRPHQHYHVHLHGDHPHEHK